MSGRAGAPDPALRLLGIAARAGAVIPGTERVREAARAGGLQLAVVAADAAENAREKLVPILERQRLPYVIAYTRLELGDAVGRAPLSAVAVMDPSLARRIGELLGRSRVEE